jgi:hypothetical protein
MSSVFNHPLSSSSFPNLVRMIRRYGCDGPFLPRLAGVGLLSLLRQPVIGYEALRHGAMIRSQELRSDPVFVIGHWRSGTTHLQNILSKDPQFAGVTLVQAAMPLDFLTLGRFLSGPLADLLPRKRLMDNVAVDADAPWEEELALACTSGLSFYLVSFFPKAIGRIFREAVLFNDGDEHLIEQWKTDYLSFLRKVQCLHPGERLLLKNPANSARIRLLMTLFPDARFIHIHRDPYKVFASTVHLYLKAQLEWGFHRADREAVVEHVLETYPLLMKSCIDQSRLLPPDRLAEVRFRDLEEEPMSTLKSIYLRLGIEGFGNAAPRFRRYLDSISDYRKNQLELSPREKQRVQQRWGEFFTHFNYPL